MLKIKYNQQNKKMFDSKKKILLIDGDTAAGKSTCLGFIQSILNEDFCYLPEYSTRLPRTNESNGDIFCESIFITEPHAKKLLRNYLALPTRHPIRKNMTY
jgi:guanylate kinase